MFQGLSKVIMAIGVIAILTTSCKKVTVVCPENNEPMKQVFYTQEGKKYVLKTVSKVLDDQPGGPYDATPVLVFNSPGFSENPFRVLVDSPRKIIPISCTATARNTSGTVIDITSCYYALIRTTVSYDHLQGISKSIPLIDSQYYTNENFYSYNFRYTQAVYSESDFIDPNGGLQLYFVNNKTDALGGWTSASAPTMPAGSAFRTVVIFTYFELMS